MSTWANSAIAQLGASLDEIQSTVAFMEQSLRVRPRLGAMLRWEGLESGERGLVQAFISARPSESHGFRRGLLVVLVGAFEQFLRRAIQDCVVRISGEVQKWDALDGAFRNHYRVWTGRALGTVLKPPREVALDYEELSRRIGTCAAGSDAFELNGEAAALALRGSAPGELDAMLASFGVADNWWDAVGRRAGVQKLVAASGARDAAKRARERLEQIVELRNECAHSGVSGRLVESEFVVTGTTLVREISLAVVDVLDERVRHVSGRVSKG